MSSTNGEPPQMSDNKTSQTALIFTSVGCLVVVVLMTLVGGALTPDYSHASQFISELGARGAPNEMWVRFAGFLPAGVLLLAFCIAAFVSVPRSLPFSLGLIGLAIYAAGYLVAAFFPCDLGCRPAEPSTSQAIHNIGGLAGYFLAPGFLFSLAFAARRWPSTSKLVVTGYTAAGVALVGLLTLSPSSDIVGLSQRALEISVLGWIVMLAFYLAEVGKMRLTNKELNNEIF